MMNIVKRLKPEKSLIVPAPGNFLRGQTMQAGKTAKCCKSVYTAQAAPMITDC
jgi:hypothetical protein